MKTFSSFAPLWTSTCPRCGGWLLLEHPPFTLWGGIYHNTSIIIVSGSYSSVPVPQFLAPDIPLFKGIISDLFPGVQLPKPDYDEFLSAANQVSPLNYITPCFVF